MKDSSKVDTTLLFLSSTVQGAKSEEVCLSLRISVNDSCFFLHHIISYLILIFPLSLFCLHLAFGNKVQFGVLLDPHRPFTINHGCGDFIFMNINRSNFAWMVQSITYA